MRVMKGKKLSGHMGVETVTIQNLEIIEVNPSLQYILVSGSIPGAKNSMVFIKSAVKRNDKAAVKELISYEEETVADEVIEEVEEKEEVSKEETTPEETKETPDKEETEQKEEPKEEAGDK